MDKLKQSTLTWAILGLLLLPSQHALSTQTVSNQTLNAMPPLQRPLYLALN